MSMGTPGWNPGQDAMRAQQEAMRLQQDAARRMNEDAMRVAQDSARMARDRAGVRRTSSASGAGRWLGRIVGLLLVAAMVLFGLHELDQHQNAPDPGSVVPCTTVPGDCAP